ncbi:ABC transporter substrate-binding protein [Ammoniphilus sp. 3BR4]|uniref:ABC transporter substrate-binding protein n=1 Tax=Ammoniphilus sp. 3BR4 TaxID=3158265 RepID=UPI0034652786
MSVIILEDDLQRTVSYQFPPKKIISLCPSITETLYALHLSDEIIGRTRYCIHPAHQIKQAAIVGGTKQINEDIVQQLRPDLIIAEKEENPREMIENLAKSFPVYVINVENYDDALKMIGDLGYICNQQKNAEKIVIEIQERFQYLESANQTRVAYVIWKKPYMVAGNHTFINSILEKCGFINVFKDRPERYPVVTMEELQQANLNFIFLSSEPYPFKARDEIEFVTHVPGAKPILVDGEIFSWYGVRMRKAVDYLNHLINEVKDA